MITESSAAFIYFRICFADCGGILFNSFSLKFAECGVAEPGVVLFVLRRLADCGLRRRLVLFCCAALLEEGELLAEEHANHAVLDRDDIGHGAQCEVADQGTLKSMAKKRGSGVAPGPKKKAKR